MISHVTRIFSVLCLFETGAMGDARLCTFEINGETKYYVCPRNEHCCKVGCCLSHSFQFYQLWCYWLMVIFMLVVCSGGQWWYKYWVDGSAGERSGCAPSVMIRATASTVTQPLPRPRLGAAASSSATSASTSATVPTSFTLIHQICKPHHYHSRGDRKAPSPYDQIYGPPPSYESVIGNGHPLGVLPAYSVSPEPSGSSSSQPMTGSDPLDAVQHTPIRGQCPSYSESQLDRGEYIPNESDSHVESAVSDNVESTTSHSVCDSSMSSASNNVEQTASHSIGESSTSNDLNNSAREETSAHEPDVMECDNSSDAVNNSVNSSNNDTASAHIECAAASMTDSQDQTHHSSQCLDHQQH